LSQSEYKRFERGGLSAEAIQSGEENDGKSGQDPRMRVKFVRWRVRELVKKIKFVFSEVYLFTSNAPRSTFKAEVPQHLHLARTQDDTDRDLGLY
jgi:hypothetical protein